MSRAKILFHLAIFIIFLAYPADILAKSNPSLEAIKNDRSIKTAALSFKYLDIKVDLVGGVTQTYIEAEIYNSSEEDVEGEFTLLMPDGAIINHYALDIEGHLVSGVLTQKEIAEAVYTDRVTDNIDPGIAELATENTYKTRIFPIPSEGSRRIAIGFVNLISIEDYALDLKSGSKIGNLKFSVPYSETSLGDNPSLMSSDVGEYFLENEKLDARLTIPMRPADNVLTRHASGKSFYSFGLTQAEQGLLFTSQKFTPSRLRIYWDHSLSRAKDDHAAERGILRSFLRETSPASVELITATDHITSHNVFDTGDIAKSVDKVLSALDYDGGSDLPALLSAGKGEADSCIFVSDGNSTLGGKMRLAPSCPVYSLSSSNNANTAMLNMVASETGGYAVTDTSSRRKALEILEHTPQGQIQGSNVAGLIRLGQGAGTVFVVPLIQDMPKTINLTLIGGNGEPFTLERDLRDVEFISHSGVGALWAANHAEGLRARGTASVSDIVTFSRPFGISGPESALLVLEEVSDYIEAEITPPEDFPAELMEDYTEALAEFNEERSEERAERLGSVIEIWNDHVDWWEKDYSEEKTRKRLGENNAPAPVAVPPPPIANAPEASTNYRAREEENDQVVVTGSRIQTESSVQNDIGIAIRKWSPDRPYLKALKAAEQTRFEDVYRQQRASFGDLPAFYLEVGDLLFQNGNKTRASQVVLGALELPSANSDTQTLVAHRLLMYGEFDRAIELYEKVLDSSVNRPQPYYNLAVALIERAGVRKNEGDLLSAIGHLDHIIRNIWNGNDDGIEIVALMEANAAIHKLSREGLKEVSLDDALIKNLDVDLRIVMDWNVDDADIDLWVAEPSGEKASYNNQLTLSGGQVSNDMTDGYGPEQYLLRRAAKGTYVIRSDLYSSDAYNPNGAIGIRARVMKNFGRSDASSETTVIELSDKGQDEFIIGKYEVE